VTRCCSDIELSWTGRDRDDFRCIPNHANGSRRRSNRAAGRNPRRAADPSGSNLAGTERSQLEVEDRATRAHGATLQCGAVRRFHRAAYGVNEAADVTGDDLISIIFTIAPDLTAALPAYAARKLG
jgi:hypothetical protein